MSEPKCSAGQPCGACTACVLDGVSFWAIDGVMATLSDRVDRALAAAREQGARIHRAWAMPNADTFSIPPIRRMLSARIRPGMQVVDPFARNSTWGTTTNDLNPDTDAHHHLPAEVFLAKLGARAYDVALFDPPYSPRQMTECYSKVGHPNNGRNAKLYSAVRAELDRVLRPGGLAFSFGWNSSGFGKKYGYERLETLLVCHGGAHNDTICVVERKPLALPTTPEEPKR